MYSSLQQHEYVKKTTVLLPRGAIRCLLNCQHADEHQLMRRYGPSVSTLDMDSSHGQPASCWVRPANVYDGLENCHLDPRSGGLEVSRGVVCPKNYVSASIEESSGQIVFFIGDIRIIFASCSEPTSKQTPHACMVDRNHKLRICASVPNFSWNVDVRCIHCSFLIAVRYTRYQIQVVRFRFLRNTWNGNPK